MAVILSQTHLTQWLEPVLVVLIPSVFIDSDQTFF